MLVSDTGTSHPVAEIESVDQKSGDVVPLHLVLRIVDVALGVVAFGIHMRAALLCSERQLSLPEFSRSHSLPRPHPAALARRCVDGAFLKSRAFLCDVLSLLHLRMKVRTVEVKMPFAYLSYIIYVGVLVVAIVVVCGLLADFALQNIVSEYVIVGIHRRVILQCLVQTD